jgi:hypothetical protein
MKKLIGVWLDTKQAVLIEITDKSKRIKTITSEIDSKERISGESKRFGRFGQQYLNPEKHKRNKIQEQVKLYLQQIIEEIKQFDSLLVFGPSEMKNKLKKEIQKHKDIAEKLSSVQTADHMTENQMVAWVRKHFTKTGALSQE